MKEEGKVLKSLLRKYQNLSIQVRASLWFLICSFLQKGISCVTTPIFTRLLSTNEYGEYSVFVSWQGIILIVISLNLWSGGYMQGLVKFENDRERYSSSLQGLTLVLVLCWSVLYTIFHAKINNILSLSTIQVICIIILVWTSSAFSFWASEQRVDFKYKQLVWLTVIVSVVKPILGILLVMNSQDKVTARIVGLVIVELLYLICFVSQLKNGRTFYSKKYWVYSLKFNLPLLPHYLSMTVLSSSDRIMIQQITGKGNAGIYSLAYSISMIMTLFNSALLQTVEPWMYKKIKEKKIEEISKVAYPSFLLIAGVNIILIILAPEIIHIFAPSEYWNAIWVIAPVAMSCYFMFSYSFFAVFEFYYEKTKNITIATCIAALLNISLNYIFIKKYGYYAAGYTTLLCYIFFALFHYVMMRRICKIYINNRKAYNTKILLLISLGFIGCGIIALFTYQLPIVRYVLVLITLIIIVIFRDKIKNYRHLLSK